MPPTTPDHGRPPRPGDVVKRHPLGVRLGHWGWFLALTVLFMSGLQIFNAAPYLDASDLSDPAHRVLQIGADAQNHGLVMLFGHTFTTTGWFGYVDDGQGSMSARAFPGWITMPAVQDLASGRQWHFFFGWILVASSVVWAISAFVRGEAQNMILRPADLPKLWPMQAYYFRLRKEPPDYGDFNPLQKAGYTVVVFFLIPFMILTGLCMSPGFDTIAHPIVALLGGRQFARTWHFVAMTLLLIFFFGHVFLVATTGFLNNMRGIVLGRYKLAEHEGVGP